MPKKRPALTIVPSHACIEVRGAWQNNLKGFDIDLPLGKLIVVTGPSGSGKSSLAFDTIYAEGQRRYVETFSPYTRQFLDRMDKPRVDEIRGIPPAIAIEQTNNVKSTRSTVGTMTEINDYLKLLFPRIATARCPECSQEIRPESAKSIVEHVFGQHGGETVLVTFGVPAPAGTKPADFFSFLQQQGYLRVWLDGEILRTDEEPNAKRLPAVVEVIQDRVSISEEGRARLTEAAEHALRLGGGKLAIRHPDTGFRHPYSTGWHCAHCDVDIVPPSPGLFSFNHPLGACPTCRGFGRTIAIDLQRAIPDRSLSIEGGCVKPFQTESGADCQRDLLRCAKAKGVDAGVPFSDMSEEDQEWVLEGEDSLRPTAQRREGEELWKEGLWYGVRGFFRWMESKAYKMHVRVLLSRYRNYSICPDCHGGRYQPATLNYRFAGKTLPELQLMPLGEAHDLLVAAHVNARADQSPVGSARAVTSAATDQTAAADSDPIRNPASEVRGDSTTEMLLGEVRSRLGFLLDVGLGYLSLDRPTRTLSGGEVERVNLTTCLGASLVNTLFVLDEPSIGLHPRDTGRLIRVMKSLRDKGNTLLVVEHEEAVMRAADHLVELGPGRGEGGGELVFAGPAEELLGNCKLALANCALQIGASPKTAGTPKRGRKGKANSQFAIPNPQFAVPRTLTAAYLTGEKSIPIPATRRTPSAWLRVEGARENNLRNLTVEFPLGVFSCVTGVSGSGKSTLVHSVLYENLLNAKGVASGNPLGALRKLVGARQISQVILVDQTQLSRTPKSTAALYLGIFDDIREMFAMTEEALREGLTASAFSFNGGAGRCERCGGSGFEKIEMQFLSDVFVRCPECEGRRYQSHVLKIHVEGKSIHDVLELTVTEAVKFFEKREAKRVVEPLRVLEEVGLGYIRLGQPLNVLSGGESQRLKLVERLTQQDSANALLILDEPTTGLHFDDVAMLVKVFDRLVEQGNSLLVIEHNLEVIKCADYVLDLGPEAGTAGGLLVAKGTPEEVAAVDESHTGRYLRDVLRGTDDARSWSAAPGEDGQSSRVAEDSPLAVVPKDSMPASGIGIYGAREHNLKNITLTIPRDQLVVITGLSGSGKSTLAFDLLFAEGQRRFLDVMSPYARQFVEQLEKPDVDRITGLPPSVAIEQRVTRGGGKSTVATVTEVYHFLRLLFSKLGVQHCPDCGCAVESQTAAAVTRRVEEFAKRGRIGVFATLVKARKGFHTDIAKWARRQGFETLLVDGKMVRVDEFTKLERFREHTIEVLVGERTPADTSGPRRRRLAELVKNALKIGRGTIRVLDTNKRGTILSTEQACPDCGLSFDELDPRLFSFNSPHGWCTECRGFGEVWKHHVNPRLETALEQELDIERQGEALEEGEAVPCPSCKGERLNPQARAVRLKTSNVQRPASNVQIAAKHSRTSGRRTSRPLDVERSTLDVGRSLSITDFASMPVSAALEAVQRLTFTDDQKPISQDIVPEIVQRLTFMGKVGLDYLGLGRSAKTLSGGESQRIRLAAQLGSNLRGVLYVLDEPTIGLHPRDNDALLDTLVALRGKGNSLVVVEHDEETMRRADTVVDLGPLAGVHGGEVCAIGTLDDIAACERSATGKYLRHPLQHPTRGTRRSLEGVRWLGLHGATTNNLKNVDVRFPIGCLSVITGISGSGKSTLMRGVLKPSVQAALKEAAKRGKAPSAKAPKSSAAKHAKQEASLRPAGAPHLEGIEFIEAVHEVDQSPIGKTSRSTPATYLGVFNEIRALFAQLPTSRMRGFTASRFSFNTEGGRCETCGGQGVIRMEMAFLPTSYQPCTDCHGKRFNPATLEALYNDKSIGDVMEMSLAEASEFFKAAPKIHRPLALLCDTGLGYLRLGQPSPTLSGGEAQRLKLVAELVQGVARDANSRLRRQREPKSTLYLLEEPTIGLHMADVAELLKVLHRLVDEGATVLVIEHNLSLIADADYVVDIGPEAGVAGGEVVAFGTPEEVAQCKVSRTAPFLRGVLSPA